MNKILITVAVVLSLASCKSDREFAEEKMTDIQYVSDQRTGLCFAFVDYGGGDSKAMAMAQVPCEKVLELIKP